MISKNPENGSCILSMIQMNSLNWAGSLHSIYNEPIQTGYFQALLWYKIREYNNIFLEVQQVELKDVFF